MAERPPIIDAEFTVVHGPLPTAPLDHSAPRPHERLALAAPYEELTMGPSYRHPLEPSREWGLFGYACVALIFLIILGGITTPLWSRPAKASAQEAPASPGSAAARSAVLRLKAAVMSHWRPDCGASRGAHVSLRFLLDDTGAIRGTPSMRADGDPDGTAEHAALSALHAAAPFGAMPAHDIILRFESPAVCTVNTPR